MRPSTLLFILAALLFGIFLFLIRDLYLPGDAQLTVPPEPVACTMDAKLCPDGTAVGRVPPSCEFAPCPGGAPAANDTAAPVEPIACTREAKICPDGSAVGRVGPNCEFAPCPGVSADSFAACVAAGNPVMESYPRQCRWPNGTTVTEQIAQ